MDTKKPTKTDIQVWQEEAKAFEALALAIVENHKQFAWAVVDAWLKKHHYLLTPAPDKPN